MPNMLLVSGYHELTKELAVMGNFGWQEWSQFGAVELTVSGDNPQSLTATIPFSDTYHGALGAQYRLFETWLLSGGVAYDSAPLNSGTRSPIFPIDRQIRGGVGVQKAVSDVITLGFQYEYLDLGSASLSRSSPVTGTLVGDYSTNQVNVVSVNLAARF
jgi:long-chain fatty acid transport protein